MHIKKIAFCLLTLLFLMFTGCDKTESTPAVQQEENLGQPDVEAEETVVTEPEEVLEIGPAVVLRDEARVWENKNGTIGDELKSLDMGTSVVFLGKQEKLKSRNGNTAYNYSKVRLDDNTEGWISSYRLALNSVPGVLVVNTCLYEKPRLTSPTNRNIPAGQIVAVSLEYGNVNGFAKIKFSYYYDEGKNISDPMVRFVEFENISSDTNDIDTAKLVLKAFRNKEQRDEFFNYAFDQNPSYESGATLIGDQVAYELPDMISEPIEVPSNINVLAINPIEDGKAQSWYLTQVNDGKLAWINSQAVSLDFKITDKVTQRPTLEDKSTYRGNGKQSVVLYQNLSFKELIKDENGKESLKYNESLELGQIVYYLGNERTFDDREWSEVELVNGSKGWCRTPYIAVDAAPAVVTQEGNPVFKEPKLTALSSEKLTEFQIIAVYLNEESSFFKISYHLDDKDKLYREVFLQKSKASLSYMADDINATLLFQQCLDEDTEAEAVDLYLRKAAEIPSFFKDRIDELYYEAKGEQ